MQLSSGLFIYASPFSPNFSTQWRVPLRPFVCDFSERTPFATSTTSRPLDLDQPPHHPVSFFNYLHLSPFSSSLSVATPLRLFI